MHTPEPKINTSRLLLAKLRGGDYAHAGDEEAIDIVVRKVLSFDPSIKSKATLDVGSGFGGSANYLYDAGFHNIEGIDLDQAAVIYAKEKYPSIEFTAANALCVDQLYPPNHFSFIYLFNVIYAIQDKATLVTKLAAISKPGAILVVFDYTQGKPSHTSHQKDLAGKPMFPIQINQFKRALKDAGWEILEVTPMTQNYIIWYKNLLQKFSIQSEILKKEFPLQDLSKVKETFTTLLNQLEQGTLGATLIYARKQSEQ